jgi:23S rRNA (cytidine1920-2'-O)/16S rRNA (cytidine1409-2'-O)-methyltransferase
MGKPVRLDSELVRRKLAPSREQARRAVEQGRVAVQGIPATKPSTLVSPDAAIEVVGDPRRFVSRGGEKLDGALESLDVRVEGRRWLDVGASTGGFTDRLLQGGAEAVVALDVGYGQLDWEIRKDPRVIVMERFNVRGLLPSDLPWRPDGVVADLSFISLTLVMPALAGVAGPASDIILLVKPQFEVGREEVGRKGVVRDPALWRKAMSGVVDAGEREGLELVGAAPSRLPGPAGNREFFVHLRPAASGSDRSLLDAAVASVSR